MKGKNNTVSGFTLVEIMIVISIISLLSGISIPRFLKARSVAQATSCINQLRQIDEATQTWALENKKGEQQTVQYTDINPYLKGTVVCPAGGTGFADSYSLTIVAERPTCKKSPTGVNPHVLPGTPSS
jgi:prepilin-type N-terminal cleavage/methylation domain-containing protein